MKIYEILTVKTIPKDAKTSYSSEGGIGRIWRDTLSRLTSGPTKELDPMPFELPNRVFECIGELRMFFFESKKKSYPIMMIQLIEFQNGYQVENIRIEPSYRGKSLAMKAYVAFSDWTGDPLYSGPNQTSDSIDAIWRKLFQIHPKRVVGFDQRTQKDLPLKMTEKGLMVHDKQHVYNPMKNPTTNFWRDQYLRANRTRLLKLLPLK